MLMLITKRLYVNMQSVSSGLSTRHLLHLSTPKACGGVVLGKAGHGKGAGEDGKATVNGDTPDGRRRTLRR